MSYVCVVMCAMCLAEQYSTPQARAQRKFAAAAHRDASSSGRLAVATVGPSHRSSTGTESAVGSTSAVGVAAGSGCISPGAEGASQRRLSSISRLYATLQMFPSHTRQRSSSTFRGTMSLPTLSAHRAFLSVTRLDNVSMVMLGARSTCPLISLFVDSTSCVSTTSWDRSA